MIIAKIEFEEEGKFQTTTLEDVTELWTIMDEVHIIADNDHYVFTGLVRIEFKEKENEAD